VCPVTPSKAAYWPCHPTLFSRVCQYAALPRHPPLPRLSTATGLVTARRPLANESSCACTGILVYNGLVDLIIPTFSDRDMPQQWWMQALGFGSLFTGAGVMSLIAKWA